MKKLLLLLILSFFSAQGFAAGCPDGSEPVKSISEDGTYFVFNCNQKSSKASIKNSNIPSNAFASGPRWFCNSGYKKSGNRCVINTNVKGEDLGACIGTNEELFNDCFGEVTFKQNHPNWPGATYMGEWKDGKPNGHGTAIYGTNINFPDMRYVGEFKNGLSHGYGVMAGPDGADYEGEWLNDKRSGQGILYFTDDVVYFGQFENDLINGQGTMTWPDGGKYVGPFVDDWQNGQGTFYYPDGTIYYGEFQDGIIHGEGTMTWSDGTRYIGEFKDDQRTGSGIVFFTDGSSEEGVYKDGIFQYAKAYIPNNASAYGSGWLCDSGYKNIGNLCEKIDIPNNSISDNSGFKCDSGFIKIDDECIEDDKVFSASSGSGFAVTSDGYVVTNYHVIEDCTNVYIHDKGVSILSTVVTFDPINDIALLKGEFKPKRFYPLSRESPKLLTEVYVAGHPFGRDISTSVKVTRGIVSSLTGIANNFSNLQIDAALQPGNSGGPIFNDKGNIIGVAVAKLDLEKIIDDYGVVPENVNFGVKSNVVINIMESENIPIPSPNVNPISMGELGEMITDGTYYLSCWMTMAQINKVRDTKVIFKNLK
jgi:hypothetical protein